MSSIQAYKAHKQEGTIAATTLVSKGHKQGALSTSSQASHASISAWLCTDGYANQCTMQNSLFVRLLDMHKQLSAATD